MVKLDAIWTFSVFLIETLAGKRWKGNKAQANKKITILLFILITIVVVESKELVSLAKDYQKLSITNKELLEKVNDPSNKSPCFKGPYWTTR